MKRIIPLFLLASIILSACLGNTSLWGQYLTPTPVGWIPQTDTPVPTDVLNVAPTDFPFPTLTPVPSSTPTLANFVTKDAAAQTAVESIPTSEDDSFLYYAQSGDWLPAVATRFEVGVNEITSPKILPQTGFIDTGTLLIIPDQIDKSIALSPAVQFIPDSEVVFSSTAADFDVEQYVNDAGGYLSTYREYLGTTAWTSGAREIERIAFENSLNPRLLLAILDYESNWVRGRPDGQFRSEYPMGYQNFRNKGLFLQMVWAVNQLHAGYYGWRTGDLTGLTFNDGKTLRLDPTLNAGTVAVMALFARLHSLNEWLRIMDVNGGFPAFYTNMFGDPFSRADLVGSFFPPGLSQPEMVLPFAPGSTWSFTGGPHGAWETDYPLAAVDFAPRNDRPGCYTSAEWVLATAAGLVVRSGNGVVVLDMDGDGSEQTGWNIMYLHIANSGRAQLGQWIEQNGRIGHASCEGGVATGTHVHIARKYNGEWMLADGPIPFTMSGWTVIGGDKPYIGKLVNGNKVVTADVYGQAWSLITRDDE